MIHLTVEGLAEEKKKKGDSTPPRANGAVCTDPPGEIERDDTGADKGGGGGGGGADDEEDKSGSQVNLVEPEPETSMGKYLKNLHKTNPDSVLNELPTCCITLPDAIYRSLFK